MSLFSKIIWSVHDSRPVTKCFQHFRAQQRRDNDILSRTLATHIPQIPNTMAPKRSNQPGAISQVYTSLASPDNRSVVTAVAFFAVSDRSATSIPATTRGVSWSRETNKVLTFTGRCRFLAQQLERDVASSVSLETLIHDHTTSVCFLRHTIPSQSLLAAVLG